MKIGAQSYTIRDFTKTPADVKESFKRLKSMGFDMVQLSGLGPIDADELAAILKDTGIEAICTHTSWDKISEKSALLKTIEDHKKWGCRQIGIGMKPTIYPDTYDGYTDFIKKVNEICETVTESGLTFGYHNHDFEFARFKGVCAFDRMIEECPKCEIILDVFWVQAGGANPCTYIEKLKNRIGLLHLKDFRIADSKRQFAEIGQGNLESIPEPPEYCDTLLKLFRA